MIRLIQNKDPNNPSLNFLNKFRKTIVIIKNASNNTLSVLDFKSNYKKYYQDIATSAELFQKKIIPIIDKYNILSILKINVNLQTYIVEFMSNFNGFIQENIKDALEDKLKKQKVLKEEKVLFNEGYDDSSTFNLDEKDGVIVNTLKIINGTLMNWASGISKIGEHAKELGDSAKVTIPAVKSTWSLLDTELGVGDNLVKILDVITGRSGENGSSFWDTLYEIIKSILLGNGK